MTSHRKNIQRGRAAIAGAVMLAGASAARADTWTNGSADGIWQTNANWQDSSAPSSGDDVFFATPGPASHSVNVAAGGPAANARSLQFDADYTIAGSGPLAIPGAPITVTGASTATINAKITSTTGLSKNGIGTLVLGADNSTTLTGGDLKINAGTLRVSSDGNFGIPTFNKVYTYGILEVNGTFSTTRRFEPSNGIIRITAGNTLTLSGGDQLGFSSTETWTKDGPGTLKNINQTSRMGATTLAAGLTQMGGDFGYGPIIIGNATLDWQPVNGFSFIKAASVTIGSGSVFRAIGSNLTANNVLGAGGDITPTLATGTNPTDVFNVSLSSTFGGTVASTITIGGAGTVKLNHATNYPGAWNVSSGTLRVTSNGTLGATVGGAVSVAADGTLLMDTNSTSRDVNLASGASLRGTGSFSTVTGHVNVANGATANLGTLLSTDVFTISGTDRITGAADTAINVLGPGTVTINNVNPYAGGWNVNGGTLRVQAGAGPLGSGTSAIQISSGGTLELNSAGNLVTVSRNIDLKNGGTIKGGPVFNNVYGTTSVASGAAVTFSGLVRVGDGANDLTGGGSGAVIHVANFGTLALQQPSDVSANWIVDAGTLLIGDDAQLGAAANTITIAGTSAHLGTSAPLTSPRDITFNANGGFESNGFDSSFANVNGTSRIAKNQPGTLSVNRVRAGGIWVTGGVLKIKHDGSDANVSTVNTVAADNGGQLDLTNNALVVRSAGTPTGSWDGSQYTDVIGLVQKGSNDGAWDGAPGIITSETAAKGPSVLTTLAVMIAAEAALATPNEFRGISVSGADTLIAYTWGGDANLDGILNGDDYFQIDSNIGAAGSVFGYHNGDFNYDGDINGDDYFIIDSNINVGQSSPAFPTGGGASPIAVPEPAASVIFVPPLACACFGRRRAKKA